MTAKYTLRDKIMRSYNLTSTFSKVLGFQTAFKSTLFSPTLFRPMSSVSTMDIDINRTLSYWFDDPEASKKWFGGGPEMDLEIKNQFGNLIEQARASELSSWIAKPRDSLALIILFDQFSRNVYRGTPESFSADPLALDIATKSIAKGFNRQVPNLQELFFYLPLMHSETLLSQIAGIALFENLAARADADKQKICQKSTDFSIRHKECIMKFGRFPSRNEILRRKSTLEEIEYLKEFPHGF